MTRVFGFALMIGLVLVGILMSSPLEIFVDPASAMIVLGVTIGGSFASLPPARIGQALKDSVSTGPIESEQALRSSGVFFRLSELAIGAGFIGTLIGLVAMLANMDDPTAIGPAMAVALLTLLYGFLLSELFFRSAASDILARGQVEAKNSSSPFRKNRAGIIIAPVFVLLTTFMTMLVAML